MNQDRLPSSPGEGWVVVGSSMDRGLFPCRGGKRVDRRDLYGGSVPCRLGVGRRRPPSGSGRFDFCVLGCTGVGPWRIGQRPYYTGTPFTRRPWLEDRPTRLRSGLRVYKVARLPLIHFLRLHRSTPSQPPLRPPSGPGPWGPPDWKGGKLTQNYCFVSQNNRM